MPIIDHALTLASVIKLLDAGGTPSRSDLIQVMIDGHCAGAQLTDRVDEPVNWTHIGRNLLDYRERHDEKPKRAGAWA